MFERRRSFGPAVTRVVLAAVIVPSLSLAASPTTALARMPSPKTYLIVPNKSIGGARIDGTMTAAKTAWGGRPDRCPWKVAGFCQWGSDYQQRAYFWAAAGGTRVFPTHLNRVAEVVLDSGGKYEGRGPLTKFKDKYGFGIGSSAAALRKRYGKRMHPTYLGLIVRAGNISTVWIYFYNKRTKRLEISNIKIVDDTLLGH